MHRFLSTETSCHFQLSLIRPERNVQSGWGSHAKPKNPVLNQVCVGGKQPAQPAAVEVVVSGLHGPSPFSPAALLLRQNHFQAAPLCSKRSALCAMGEGSSAGRETAVTVTSTAARTPFWKGYVVADIPISTWLECIIILCVQCVQCFLLNCQTNKLSASHMDNRGRKSGLFFCLDVGSRGGKLFKVKVCRERKHSGFFSASQQ